MKRMGIFIGAVAFVFILATFHADNPVFADSCCSVKKDAHECNKECESGCIKKTSASEGSDNTCPVCGKASDSEGQQVDVEHGGETVHLCCEGCADAYEANPDKYSKVESKEEHPKPEHPRSEHPKKKKERGSSYY
jgi:YHS domain-containing protein